jgi:hypothetical protein
MGDWQYFVLVVAVGANLWSGHMHNRARKRLEKLIEAMRQGQT